MKLHFRNGGGNTGSFSQGVTPLLIPGSASGSEVINAGPQQPDSSNIQPVYEPSDVGSSGQSSVLLGFPATRRVSRTSSRPPRYPFLRTIFYVFGVLGIFAMPFAVPVAYSHAVKAVDHISITVRGGWGFSDRNVTEHGASPAAVLTSFITQPFQQSNKIRGNPDLVNKLEEQTKVGNTLANDGHTSPHVSSPEAYAQHGLNEHASPSLHGPTNSERASPSTPLNNSPGVVGHAKTDLPELSNPDFPGQTSTNTPSHETSDLPGQPSTDLPGRTSPDLPGQTSPDSPGHGNPEVAQPENPDVHHQTNLDVTQLTSPGLPQPAILSLHRTASQEIPPQASLDSSRPSSPKLMPSPTADLHYPQHAAPEKSHFSSNSMPGDVAGHTGVTASFAITDQSSPIPQNSPTRIYDSVTHESSPHDPPLPKTLGQEKGPVPEIPMTELTGSAQKKSDVLNDQGNKEEVTMKGDSSMTSQVQILTDLGSDSATRTIKKEHSADSWIPYIEVKNGKLLLGKTFERRLDADLAPMLSESSYELWGATAPCLNAKLHFDLENSPQLEAELQISTKCGAGKSCVITPRLYNIHRTVVSVGEPGETFHFVRTFDGNNHELQKWGPLRGTLKVSLTKNSVLSVRRTCDDTSVSSTRQFSVAEIGSLIYNHHSRSGSKSNASSAMKAVAKTLFYHGDPHSHINNQAGEKAAKLGADYFASPNETTMSNEESRALLVPEAKMNTASAVDSHPAATSASLRHYESGAAHGHVMGLWRPAESTTAIVEQAKLSSPEPISAHRVLLHDGLPSHLTSRSRQTLNDRGFSGRKRTADYPVSPHFRRARSY